MATRTLEAVYERGVLRPIKSRTKLPFREHARVILKITMPESSVLRTRGIIKVSAKTADQIVYGPKSVRPRRGVTPWTDATRGCMKISKRLAKRIALDPELSPWFG